MDAKGLASYYDIHSESHNGDTGIVNNQVHSYWIFGIIQRVNYTLLANNERIGDVNKLFVLVSCKLNDLTTFFMINPSYSTQ